MAACRGILLGLLSKTLFKAQSSQLPRLTLSRRGHQNAASRNCLLTTAPCMSPGLDPVPLSPHRTKTFPSQRTPTAGNAPQRSQEERPGGCGVVQISPPGLGRRPPPPTGPQFLLLPTPPAATRRTQGVPAPGTVTVEATPRPPATCHGAGRGPAGNLWGAGGLRHPAPACRGLM